MPITKVRASHRARAHLRHFRVIARRGSGYLVSDPFHASYFRPRDVIASSPEHAARQALYAAGYWGPMVRDEPLRAVKVRELTRRR